MRSHAVDITLSRSVTRRELAQTVDVLRLATNHDRTRLLAVVRAKTIDRALQQTRRALEPLLPLDTLSTHFPDAAGRVLLNVAFPPAEYAFVQDAATRAGQPPASYVRDAVTRATDQVNRENTRHLERALDHVLTTHTPQQLLAAAARRLNSAPGMPGC
ncbi:hypothetical protein [Streptomyces sp. AcH 505]|uniref:hypothetical protein n=1 Tax=Streptomyces sp. AcH 505 TaxID=352211 RepID=UPI000693C8B1